jgi:flagellar hook-basal body complex protein FliE
MRITAEPTSLLQNLRAIQPAGPEVVAPPSAGATSQVPFMSALASAVQNVNETQQAAGAAAQDLATGRADNVHDVIVAMEKADLSLQLTVQTTQRALDAYREISRMQV